MTSEIEAFQKGQFVGFADIPDDIYNADKLYFRNSWQGDLMITPAHARYSIENPKNSDVFNFGRAFHFRVESLEKFQAQVAVSPDVDGRTKDGKLLLKAFKEKAQAKTIISHDEAERIEAMARVIYSEPKVKALLEGGKAERAMCWKDKETGVMCKAKMDLDLLDKGAMLDFKTTDLADFKSTQRAIANYGYFRQAAMYLSGASVLLGRSITDFIFMPVEKKPPHEFGLYRIDDASVERGMIDFNANLKRFKKCRETGEWPGYARQVLDINLPSWAFQEKYG